MKKIILVAALLMFAGISTKAFAETWAGWQWDYEHGGGGSLDWTGDGVLDFLHTGTGGTGWAAAVKQGNPDFSNGFWYAAKYHHADGVSDGVDLRLGLGKSSTEIIGSRVIMSGSSRDFGLFDTIKGSTITVTDFSGGASVPSDGWMGLEYTLLGDRMTFGLFNTSGTLRIFRILRPVRSR